MPSKLAQPLSGQGEVKIYAITCGTVLRAIFIGVEEYCLSLTIDLRKAVIFIFSKIDY